jgi:sec-independent protein translocase protein TatB
MFDLGWTELLVIGIVALIVVGPKDLPVLFRRVGQFVGKAKGMAREFSQAMNDAADESGIREVSSGINKSLKAASNPLGTAMDGVKEATKGLTDIDPESETGRLSAERREEAARIKAAAARKAAERKQREAADALAKAEAAEAEIARPAPPAEVPAEETPASKKAAPKKAAAKKAPAKKPAAKKTSSEKSKT